MTDAGFFRGTSSEQDNRFSDKEKKLLKQMKFSDNLTKKVDMTKVNLTVLKPWIANRIQELLGMEDDVLNEFVYNQLEENNNPDGRRIQINLTGFLNGRNARIFTGELWDMLLDAMSNSGIPSSILNAKKEEISQRIKAEPPMLVTPDIQDIEKPPKASENRSEDHERRSSSRYHQETRADKSSDQDKYRSRRYDNDVPRRSDRSSRDERLSREDRSRDDRSRDDRHHREDRYSKDDRPSRDDRYRDDRRDDRSGREDRYSRSQNSSNRRSRFSDYPVDDDVPKPKDDETPVTEEITLQEKKLPDRRSGDDSPPVEMKKRKKSKNRHHRKRKSSSSSDPSDEDEEDDSDDDRREKRRKRRSSREKKKKKKGKKSRSREHSHDKSLEQELRNRALESMRRQKIEDME